MSNNNSSTIANRRRFLSQLALGAAALPLLRWAPAQAADLPHLSVDDPSAKALGYTESAAKLDPKTEASYKPGSRCGSCALFQGKDAQGDYAGCAAFPGKAVNKNGWCRAYSKAG
ncbi:MAG: high-potential iron-sulfur protein [Nevskia sp.]|nr:high-potential iron-sulfur protein [Nevskia sp.]